MSDIHDTYRRVVENMPDGCARHKVVVGEHGQPVDCVLVDVNPAFEALIGLEREQIIGRRVTEVLPDIAHPGFDCIATYGQVALAGQTVVFESYFESLRRWYEVTAYRDEPGHLVTVFHEITARKLSEQALRASEEKYRALFEHSVDPIAVVSADGMLLDANKALLDAFGYTRDDIGKVNVRDHYVNPAQRDDYLARLKRDGFVANHEAQLKRPDGTIIHSVRSAVARRDESGNIIEIQTVCRDATARRQAEEALRESEEKYRSLFEQSMDAIALVSPDGFILEANPAFCRLFGYSREELVDFDSSEMYVEPDGRQRFCEAISKLGKLVDDEVQLRRKDGTVMDCLRTVTVRRDGQGNILGYQPVIRDITEAKRAGRRLHESEEKYRSLFEQSMDAIALVSPDGFILEANQAFATLFGYTKDELIGFDSHQMYVADEGRRQFLDKIAERGELVDDEVQLRRKDGTVMDCLRTVTVRRDGQGNILGYQPVIRDITEAKRAERRLHESEEEYRTLFTQSRDAIYIATPEGKSLDANQAWLDLLGYTYDEMMCLNAYDIYADPSSRDEHRERLERQGYVENDECRLRRKDGTVLDCLRTVTIRRDAQGRSIAYQGIVRDITQQKRDQEELEGFRMELQALAARLEEIRETERTAIARELHDRVGQALTAVKIDVVGLIHGLEMGQNVEPAKLLEIVQLLDATTEDVRGISSELRPGILDDFGLLAAMQWQLTQLQERTGLVCNLVTAADDSAIDRARTTALFRVFQELLTNIVRHAAAGSVRVGLSTANQSVILTVADDGRGIREEEVHDSGSLGLIGIRERLRPLGGWIDFSGAPGKGTTVQVTMPLQ